MHSNGVILTASRHRDKLSYLIKNVNYQRVSAKNHHGMFTASVQIANRRLLYSSKHMNTLNKWYTATGEIKPGDGSTTPNPEKEYYDMICELSKERRISLAKALKHWESEKVKGELEGQLAATRWRSRFGRPTQVSPALGSVDPTGLYCAVPEDWLRKKFVETTPPPTSRDLVKLLISNALPFVGFGFLDNFIMIMAGDYIEDTLGMYWCLSTMAAAALGNTISDVLGIGSAFYIERIAESVGVKPPKLTAIQMEMKSSRRVANFGRVLGIIVGCILGMCPLLFRDGKEKAKDTKEVKPTTIAVLEQSNVEPAKA